MAKKTVKKAAPKRKVATKKVAVKKKVATKRKVATKKKAATKRKAAPKKAATKRKAATKKTAKKAKAATKKVAKKTTKKAATKPKAATKKSPTTKRKTTRKKTKAAAAPAVAAKTLAELKVGDKAPEFITQLGDNNKLSLRDFRGEKVVLYFYPKDDTPGCTQEAKDFTANIDKFTENNAVVLGVSKDNWASHCKFKEKYNFGYTFLADTDSAICDLYGVAKDKGIERSTFLIDEDGMIAQIWRGVKVPGHVDAVLAAIEGNAAADSDESVQEELLAD